MFLKAKMFLRFVSFIHPSITMFLPVKMSQMSQKQSESNTNEQIRQLSECRHLITTVFAYSHSDQQMYSSVSSSLDATHFSQLWPRNTHVFSTFIPC